MVTFEIDTLDCEDQENIDELIAIKRSDLESLLEDRKWLAALEGAGVDNWDGIAFAEELM